MWKFKTSKYKNAHPKISKKEEWITNLAAANFLPSCGNHIEASAAYIAYNSDVGGGGRGSLGLLPLCAQGRQVTNGVTHIHAHTEHVTDFKFNPFDDFNIATCSMDGSLKMWDLPESVEGVEHLTFPTATMQVGEHKVECLRWHPLANNIIAAAAGPTVKIFDLERSTRICDLTEHEDTTQALDWHGDGSLLVTGNKDRHLRVFDPRASSLAHSTKAHDGIREMRVLWLGNTDYVVSTGCDSMRNREVIIRDIRNFDEKLCVQQLDTSTGTLMPFYDPERFMLFLCGKGDTTIQYFEFSSGMSTLTFNSADHVHQMKGAAVAPKRAVDVMSAEVNHMLLLIKNAIVPLSICVPRKSYSEFHSDLFPDIPSDYPAMTSEEWLAGENKLVTTISQNPNKRTETLRKKGAAPRCVGDSELEVIEKKSTPEAAPEAKTEDSKEKLDVLIERTALVNETRQLFENPPTPESKPKSKSEVEDDKLVLLDQPLASVETKPAPVSEVLHLQHEETIQTPMPIIGGTDIPDVPLVPLDVTPEKMEAEKASEIEDAKNDESGDSFDKPLLRNLPENAAPATVAQPAITVRQKRGTKVFSGVRQCKFRHFRGTPVHKSENIENLKNVDQRLPGESDMFQANAKFCALPIAGPGGSLAVLKLSEPGRLPDAGIPVIENGFQLLDFCFDPFNNHRIVTACDDGKVRLWDIPEDGLKETVTIPTCQLTGHTDKVNIVQFHPLATNVLLSAAYDKSVRIWNISTGEEIVQLLGHTDSLLCASWSPDGRYVVSVCRDGRLRLYSPRQSAQPLQEGAGPDGTRGSRIVWACHGRYPVVVGMDRSSHRVLMLYDLAGLAQGPLYTLKLGMEPALLIPHYDPDSHTLFLTGRGDSIMLAFEVAEEPPYFFPLSNYNAGSIHQALAFLPKRDVDVQKVEFAKALRLTTNRIEPISFTVPRIKMEYFQDDLYPETEKTWEAVMTCEQWLSGINRLPERVSLKPKDMNLLSTAPVEEKKAKYESFDSYAKTYKTDEQKKDELLSAMTNKLDVKDSPLPQDLTEGVDEDEWLMRF